MEGWKGSCVYSVFRPPVSLATHLTVCAVCVYSKTCLERTLEGPSYYDLYTQVVLM